MLPGFILLVANCVIMVPYISKWVVGMKNPYTPRGVNLNLPVACWLPFHSHTGFWHVVAVSNQLIAVSCLAVIIITLLFMFLKFSQKVRYELKVLHYGIETLFKRSKRLYFKMYPERKAIRFHWTDPVYQRVVGICLKDSILHHKTIVNILDVFMTMVSIPAALAYVIGTAVIGLSLLSILNALNQGNYPNVILFALLCVGEILNMLVASLIGETLTHETIILREELYFIEWHKLNLSNRKTMLNFQTAITEPLSMKAAGLVDMNMDTFSSIMNSAYSFFNLVNAQ
uniref:Olfactory receptor n=2 Tax=Apolygus lucorum TaxID=248454 RepID=A0A1Q1NIN0_APOLU|nr:olfactory receptor [Apolygus lucorum]